ncbi:hypothetical protein [Acidovorax sp. Leaf160]|uniref:hypothetical protein n=1 Tax=Acidovorax sp. Leaf160 TaxID=1736280 RepID=UPI0012E3510C|nr:hypothetical protein [Acidovorax sp. Leaf160]
MEKSFQVGMNQKRRPEMGRQQILFVARACACNQKFLLRPVIKRFVLHTTTIEPPSFLLEDGEMMETPALIQNSVNKVTFLRRWRGKKQGVNPLKISTSYRHHHYETTVNIKKPASAARKSTISRTPFTKPS